MISEIREEAFERQPGDKKDEESKEGGSNPAEDLLLPVQIGNTLEEITYVGTSLTPQEVSQLTYKLRENRDLRSMRQRYPG